LLAVTASSELTSESGLVKVPDNLAFRSLKLKLLPLTSRENLSGTTPLPPQTISIEPSGHDHKSTVFTHPPNYVTPHPPWSVFSAKIDSVRELTKPGASKRTYHFDLDVTDYPQEMPGVEFRVGGAIGIVAPNDFETVAEIFDILGTSEAERDVPITLNTQGGRWPTIWGEEQARSMTTTARELLTWTVDIQSAPTKNLIRLLAEYARDEDEKTILHYLCSEQGQATFCECVYYFFLFLRSSLSDPMIN
jgi:sulfite reductase alpha subunit-like flavoprotein